ncbi:transcription factor IIF subunit tfg1 [Coemansia thaxteri]|uniref:Transcription initiation factor IIF subunit alpha n=1 Tax=Coemansia thaxteri TaxID=2663907 RepID=A0A9W8EFY9_9FUNG|nr:transcription factor IIF subunit tfg1 [Coemansia thaxteri]
MSSGIRRAEKKSSGSSGMRTLGSRQASTSAAVASEARRRTLATAAMGGRTARSGMSEADSMPLAAATGVAPVQADTRTSIEYTLVSSTRPARTHNVMRLQSPKSVDLREFTAPVKLRRRNKEYYRLKNKKKNEEKAALLEQELKKKQMSAAADGSIMEVDGSTEIKKEAASAEASSTMLVPVVTERPKADMNLIANVGGARSNKRNLFKKLTRQVFFADEEKRRLDIEEARPWVLEDDDEKEVWTGSLEGGQSSSYVLFVLTDDGFKVVPVDRWYKFTPKIKHKTLTLDEAEEELKRAHKSEAQDRWMMQKRMLRLDINADLAAGATGGAGPGGEREAGSKPTLSKLVEREVEDAGFDDDDEDDEGGDGRKGKAKKRSDSGHHGAFDEFEFEMEFDDDEELGDVQFEFNEEKDMEMKEQNRKTRAIGFGPDADEDEEDEGDAGSKLGAVGKTMRKLMRKREGNKDDKSDEEENPYLSVSEVDSDEDDEEEDESAKKQGEQKDAAGDAAAAKTQAAGAQPSKPAASSSSSVSDSKAAAAAAAAKKRKRASIAPTGHQHHQPHARASSPGSVGSGASSAGSGTEPRKHFKASSSSPTSAAASSDLITKQEIVDLIKSGVNTTKRLITCVRKKLKANPANKDRIQAIVKEVATLKDGELALKRVQ